MEEVAYDREGRDLVARGLYLDLPAWHYHVFQLERFLRSAVTRRPRSWRQAISVLLGPNLDDPSALNAKDVNPDPCRDAAYGSMSILPLIASPMTRLAPKR
jgi:hypothetical protein